MTISEFRIGPYSIATLEDRFDVFDDHGVIGHFHTITEAIDYIIKMLFSNMLFAVATHLTSQPFYDTLVSKLLTPPNQERKP